MFRHRTRRSVPALDDVTAERLLSGAPVDDLPHEYRALAELLAAARGRATTDELEGAAAATAAFASIHAAANRPVRHARTLVLASVVSVLVALSAGTAVAANEGVLPEPAQAAAHDVLGVVGISVPGIGNHDRTPDETKLDQPIATLPPEVTGGARPTTDAPAPALATNPDPVTGPDGVGTAPTPSTEPNQPDTTGSDNSNAGGQSEIHGPPSSPPGQDKQDENSGRPETPPGQDKK
jgi:hypothetical protein